MALFLQWEDVKGQKHEKENNAYKYEGLKFILVIVNEFRTILPTQTLPIHHEVSMFIRFILQYCNARSLQSKIIE